MTPMCHFSPWDCPIGYLSWTKWCMFEVIIPCGLVVIAKYRKWPKCLSIEDGLMKEMSTSWNARHLSKGMWNAGELLGCSGQYLRLCWQVNKIKVQCAAFWTQGPRRKNMYPLLVFAQSSPWRTSGNCWDVCSTYTKRFVDFFYRVLTCELCKHTTYYKNMVT